MMHAHAAAEYEIFEREVKLGHYDILRVELAKALISARAAQIRCGEARARLAKSRDREEALLVRHAEQLSKQEALMATERESDTKPSCDKGWHMRPTYASRICNPAIPKQRQYT